MDHPCAGEGGGMKPGTIVRLPDGREGTVVFHGLTGYGIVWGRRALTQRELDAIIGSVSLEIGVEKRHDDLSNALLPEAMLRDPYPGAKLPCAGSDYETVEVTA